MELEGIIIKMRGIACILKYMGYVEDDVKDKEYAMDFLSAELFECSNALIYEAEKMKNATL